jgi:hypothetical protein
MMLSFAPLFAIGDITLASGPSVILDWADLGNHSYSVERNSDLTMTAGWVALATNLLVNSYTDAVPASPAFYRIVDEGELPPAELFFDDFESGVGDWTIVTGSNHVAGTDWELGTPTTGPGAANSGTNAWGTNLDDLYGSNADIGLLSPTIDLTGLSTATLEFSNFYQAEPFVDYGYVYVRDATGAEIAGLEAPIAEYSGEVLVWTQETIGLPAAALGQTIRLEFRFVSDFSFEYDGWYIDDVRVSE